MGEKKCYVNLIIAIVLLVVAFVVYKNIPIVVEIIITKNAIDAPSLMYNSFAKCFFFHTFTIKKLNVINKKIIIINTLSNILCPPKNNHYTNHIVILCLQFQLIMLYHCMPMLLLMPSLLVL